MIRPLVEALETVRDGECGCVGDYPLDEHAETCPRRIAAAALRAFADDTTEDVPLVNEISVYLFQTNKFSSLSKAEDVARIVSARLRAVHLQPEPPSATPGEAPVICTLRTLVISGRPQIDGCRAVDLTATNAQLRQAISDIRREAQIAMSFDGIEDMCNEALAQRRDDEKGG